MSIHVYDLSYIFYYLERNLIKMSTLNYNVWFMYAWYVYHYNKYIIVQYGCESSFLFFENIMLIINLLNF